MTYLRRHGTESSHGRIRKRFAQTIDQLRAVVTDIDEATAQRVPATGGWCVQEVIDHLSVTNEAAVAELAALVAGRVPEDGPIPASLQSPDPLASSWSDACARSAAADAALLAILDTASDATPVEAKAPLAMVIKARHAMKVVVPTSWHGSSRSIGRHMRSPIEPTVWSTSRRSSASWPLCLLPQGRPSTVATRFCQAAVRGTSRSSVASCVPMAELKT